MQCLNAAFMTIVVYYCFLTNLVTGENVDNMKANTLNALKSKALVDSEQYVGNRNWNRIKRQSAATVFSLPAAAAAVLVTSKNEQRMQDFQNYIIRAKETCASLMGFQLTEVKKSYLYEQQPSPKEKCFIECILKRSKLMNSNNKLSARSVGRIADIISNNNALVISIAVATAEACNLRVNATDPCEAANQINKCIANEIKTHQVKLFY